MRPSSGQPSGSQHPPDEPLAEIRSFFNVPLPIWISGELIVLLGAAGLLAVAVTGFIPYDGSPDWLRSYVFVKPAALFGFFSLVIVTLQVLMLRHPSPRQEMAGDPDRVMPKPGYLRTGLIATLVAVAIIVINDRFPEAIPTLLQDIANFFKQPESDTTKLVANFANLWVIGVFAVDSLIRWIQSAGRLWAVRRDRPKREAQLTGVFGVIGGDSIAGSVLIAFLALVFRADVLSFFAYMVNGKLGALPRFFADSSNNLLVPNCQVSLYPGGCDQPPLPSPNQLPTISHVDWYLALYLFIFGAVFQGFYLLLRLIGDGRPPTEVVREAFAQVRNIDRVVGLTVEGLIIPVRRALWPALVLLGVGAAAVVAGNFQTYLQLLSCEHQLAWYGTAEGPCKDLHLARSVWDYFAPIPQNFEHLGLALLAGVIGAMAIVFAAVVQLYDHENPERSERQVAGYWVPAIVRVGLLAIIPIGLFSLAFFVLNYVLVVLSPQTQRVPMSFFPPGIVTYVALLALAYFGVTSFAGRTRKGK